MAFSEEKSHDEKFFYSEPENQPDRRYGSYATTPLFTTPLTPAEASMHSYQDMPRCRDFELRAVKCLEAYGWYKLNEKCELFIKDMYECVTRAKQSKRHYLMIKEHKRQIANGEREYLPTPRVDLL
ncbi:uncharacterized protein LOC128880490 [Hylaeus volcanicus]|uniref:uncharacterized protein LOC128880490 n=1 Tax=Hylaeus volcanicus TaxID=313075 RepID=UPI0023B8319E|nr:uncharacterized protein LOC128880490 [Hylaeus volcanicus]